MLDSNVINNLMSHFDNSDTNAQKWICRYIRFINFCLNRDWENVYCESHHIVPESWGGSGQKQNIIKFSYKAHVIAHQMLAKTGDRSMKIALCVLLNHFPNESYDIVGLRQAESIRMDMARAKSHVVVNLTTGEEITTHDLGVRYNCSTAVILGCIYNNTKFKGDYWQLKSVIDNSSINDELERILQLKQCIQAKANQARVKASSRPIVNLNTGELFTSAAEAARQYGFKEYTIIAGSIIKGCKCANCYWQWKDVVDETSIEIELRKCISVTEQRRLNHNNGKTPKSIINLNNGKLYNNVDDLKNELGFKRASAIYQAIKKRKRLKGCFYTWTENVANTPIDAELQKCLCQEEIANNNKKNQRLQASHSKPLKRLSDGQVFSGVSEVSRIYDAPTSTIYAAIREQHKFKDSFWQYVDDCGC